MKFHGWYTRIANMAKRTLVSLTGIVLIIVSVICVVELASRISSRSFLVSKIDEIERSLAIEFGDDQFLDSSYISNASVDSINSSLQIYRLLLDDIDHLSLTGAELPIQTIYAIRQRITEFSGLESQEIQIQIHRQQISQLREQLEDYSDEREFMLRDMIRLEQRYRQLQIQEQELPSQDGTFFLEDGRPNFVDPAIMNDPESVDILTEIELIDNLLYSVEDEIAAILSQIEGLHDKIDQIIIEPEDWKPSIFVRKNIFIYLQSDLLVGILVISCGAIGSIFAESRSSNKNILKPVLHGLMAGFVAFLVLKGGRFLFVVDFTAFQSTFVNPYAAAFAGVLAGLFTEKAYEILSSIVDDVANRTKTPQNSSKSR